MKNDSELLLEQAGPPELPETLRGRLLTEARRLGRWRKIERVWRWTLAVAAILLIVVNLQFERAHEQHMIALLGPPPVERPLHGQSIAQEFERHSRTLSLFLETSFPAHLEEDSL